MAEVDPMVLDVARRFAAEAVAKHPLCAVFLFGSHAKGCPRPGSDIDIAVVVPEIEGSDENPWLFMEANHELWEIATEIDFDIEVHLVQANKDRSGFLSSIVSTGLRVA